LAPVISVVGIAPPPLKTTFDSLLKPIRLTRVLRGELGDGRPVELFAALGEQREEAVPQEARQRHGHAQALGRGQRQADTLNPNGAANPAGANRCSAINRPYVL
jgi:hypothetical protein